MSEAMKRAGVAGAVLGVVTFLVIFYGTNNDLGKTMIGSQRISIGDVGPSDTQPTRVDPKFSETAHLKNPHRRRPLLTSVAVSAEDLPKASTYANQWKRVGPINYGGKAMDAVIDPRSPNTVYVAYVGGGIWKTTDGGNSWDQLNNITRNNQFACLEIWESDSNVIFAGLGTPGEVVNVDVGILKSTDGGRTWEKIGPDFSEVMGVYRIESHPDDANITYAATGTGVHKTLNGGKTWTKVLAYQGSNWWNDLPDMVMHPDDPNILYVAQRNIGIRVTRDGGASWKNASAGIIDNDAAIVIAVSRSNPDRMYAERDVDGEMVVYRSDDAGMSWTATATLREYHQGRYDLAISVDPTNPDRVTIANVFLYESSDGGHSFQIVTHGAPHVDHLKIAFTPSATGAVYSANDGGLWKSTDRNSGVAIWEPADRGVSTNLTYSIGLDPNTERIYASAGDYIGAFVYTGSENWTHLPGWGTEWEYYYVDPFDSRVVYYGQRGVHHRMDVGEDGISPSNRANIDPDPAGPHGYWRPIRFDPVAEGTMYVSTNRIYKSEDRGDTWRAISSVLPSNSDWAIGDFAIAPSDPNVIYAISWNEDRIYKTTDGGETWTTVTSAPVYAYAVAVSPIDPEVFYVVHPWGIHRLSEGGAVSRKISANLGEIKIRKIVVDPAKPERLFVGTPHGVFVSENDAGRWEALGNGLPRIPVWDLQLRSDGLYVAATQGVWRYDLRTGTTIAQSGDEVPEGFALHQNYPNPFNPQTTISFETPEPAHVSLRIFDLQGRAIATLVDEHLASGQYEYAWDATGHASGVFMYDLRTGDFRASKKMLLQK